MGMLKPLLQSRNCAYTKWLASRKGGDLARFKQAWSVAQRTTRAAKNSWLQEKVKGQRGNIFGRRKVWKCIRDMQRGHQGLLPSRAVVIHDKNGELCSSSASQHHRWRRHFTTVLNVWSQCDATAMEKIDREKWMKTLAAYPQQGRWLAVEMLKNRKAPGSSNVFPRMLKVAMKDGELGQMVLDLVKAVWKAKCVPHLVTPLPLAMLG